MPGSYQIPVVPFQQQQQGQAGFQQVDPQGNTFQQVDPAGLNPQGNVFQQVDPAGVQPQVNPMDHLKKWVGKLLQGGKDFINKPIIGPTITKEEHDQLMKGGGGGEHNWQHH